MLKKLIATLLALTMLFLCGCSVITESAKTIPTAESTLGSTETVDYLQKVRDLAKQYMPVYEAEPAVEFDPNRRVYIHVPKYDMDLFSGEPLLFWIYSVEPLDPQKIQLQMDCKTEYALQYMGDYSEYSCVKYTEARQLPQFSLQEYQYYSLLGVDWEELALLKAQAKAAFDLANENTGNTDAYKSYRKIYEEGQAAYEEKTLEYHTKYNELSAEDIPQFYLYYFYITFSGFGMYEETIERAELTIGSETYSMNLGQLRLYKELPQVFTDNQEFVGLRNYIAAKNGLNSPAYNGCFEKVEEMFSFDAEKDMTITGISEFTCGTEMKVLAARVRIKGKLDFFWDMQQPIEIDAGSHVDIDLYLRDPRFEEYDPCIHTYFLMDYMIGPKSYVHHVSTYFQRSMQMWDTFLMAFRGVDIGEYYTYMVTPYGNEWLQELPEDLMN